MHLSGNISALVLFTLCLIGPGIFGSPGKLIKNYLIYDDLLDGEHEVRIHYNGISAKQTNVGPHEGSPE